ncbi:MAG: type I DNA topoisomerase [Caldilineaceae bacterium]
MTKLVIVESPTKAKTIRNYLPKGYHVEASMGHIRDLPASAAEVPENYKGEPWARLGVNVEKDFDPLYVVPASKKKVVTELRKQLKEADELILATDEDREGESIGWHLYEVLKPKVPVRRMVFHEITRDAIQNALKETRTIDQDLVHAQETRRILDRLVGYTVSPLLWKKIARGLSAGRVQSVAVRLLVLRERERRAFRSGAYWDLKAFLNKRPDKPEHRFEAQLLSVGGVRVASGKDFDENTGKVADTKNVLLLDQQQAEQLRERLLKGLWRVTDLEEKESTRSPYPPFTTSTLQQEANRKLGMGAKETMRIAQALYENGYITYMRTDSVNLSDQAVDAARRRVTELYGQQYLSDKPRRYSTKTKNAQEAHEAIRPAGDQMLPADALPISGDERRLYDLIWKRTVATQMANARLKFTTATISVEDALFRASGRTVLFPGFFRAYVEGSDDPEAALESQDAPLPPLAVDEVVDCRDLEAQGHETKPPARYTEATLVKALEAEGIGRPSTYATIIDTIQQRGYAFKQRKELVPTFTAFAVTELLEKHFNDLVDLNFTATMEQKLDDIANGETNWLAYLRHFFLGEAGLENQVKAKDAGIDPRTASGVGLENLSAEVRIGQFGPFLSKEVNGERLTAGLPPDLPPADLSEEMVEQLLNQKLDGPQVVGIDPETELPVVLKVGPYGPYVQLGEEDPNSKKKPKRASLLKGMDPNQVDLNLALQLLNLPRTLGEHPETGKVVKAGVGKFGPYVVHGDTFASLKAPDSVLDIELDRALEVIEAAAARKASGGGRSTGGRVAKKNVLKELGEHPDGGPVQVLDGRYGPYVSYQKVNVTLPKEVKPEDVTLNQALAWISAKVGSQASTTPKKTTSTEVSAVGMATKKASTAKTKTAKASTAKKVSVKTPAVKTAKKQKS